MVSAGLMAGTTAVQIHNAHRAVQPGGPMAIAVYIFQMNVPDNRRSIEGLSVCRFFKCLPVM